MKKYTISIVTYRPHRLVNRSIESVLAQSDRDQIELVLTANGCREVADYFESLKRELPDVVSVNQYDENQGFIIPNNRAFAESRTPYFVLLNDDVEILQNCWLDALEAPLVCYPKAALSGPRGGCQHLTQGFDGRHGGPFEYLEGSVLMVKANMVRPEPLFSSYLTHSYGEDSDLSLRMRRKDYGLHQIDLNYSHARAQTANHVHNIRDIQRRNHRVLCRKWSHYLRVRKFDFPIIVRRWASRGDVLLTTPIVRALALQNPLSPIKVETAFPEFFAGNPYVAEAATSVPPTCDTRFINLDMAYENTTYTHVIDAYAQAAEVADYDRVKEIHLSADARQQAAALLDEGKWVAMHVGPTTWPGKNWPLDRFSNLARVLKNEQGLRTVLVGHRDAEGLECDLDLRDMTSAMVTAAVIERCRLFVGLDSFPMHLAQTVGTPTIGLFGQTSPQYIMTDESPHIGIQGDRTIHETGIRHRIPGQTFIPGTGDSMRSISVDQVVEAAGQLLRGHNGRKTLSMADVMSETSKYRALTTKYCYRDDGQPGCGVDLASQGDPVVPWAIQLELPPLEFAHYNSNHEPYGPIQLRGHADRLPFDNASLDFVYSSHLLEDYVEWSAILGEWVRVLKPGGKLIVLVPDKARWAAALARGQPPNCAHRHEAVVGELSTYAPDLGLQVVEDRLTNCFPDDYSILFVGART